MTKGGAALDPKNVEGLCHDCHLARHPKRIDPVRLRWRAMVQELI